YPRVKVRLQEQDDVLISLEKDDKSIPGFKNVSQSPSVIGSSVKGKQNGSLTLPSCAKIPETDVPKLEIPLSSLSKGPTKNSRRARDVRDDPKLSWKPNSISRPRAVLSSPENDKTIGSQNKKNIKRPLLSLKKQGLQHSTSQVYVNSVNDKRCLKQCNSMLEPHVSGQKNKLHENSN
ncbi:Testis-expressed sequence 15 protein, partial [Actinidia chinensis var. chinensis]